VTATNLARKAWENPPRKEEIGRTMRELLAVKKAKYWARRLGGVRPYSLRPFNRVEWKKGKGDGGLGIADRISMEETASIQASATGVVRRSRTIRRMAPGEGSRKDFVPKRRNSFRKFGAGTAKKIKRGTGEPISRGKPCDRPGRAMDPV